MKYLAVLIDLDGTIFNFKKSEEIALKNCLRMHNIILDGNMLEKYQEINRGLWRKFENNEITKAEVLNERFEKLFRHYNYNIDSHNFNMQYQNQLTASCELNDDVNLVLDYLKEKYALYVVTNGLIKTQRARLKKTGIENYFKDIFISEEIGYQKPNKRFFDYCFDRISEKRGQCIIIGDSLNSDILGGLNSGIDTCWFNPDYELNHEVSSINYEIHHLKDILSIL